MFGHHSNCSRNFMLVLFEVIISKLVLFKIKDIWDGVLLILVELFGN